MKISKSIFRKKNNLFHYLIILTFIFLFLIFILYIYYFKYIEHFYFNDKHFYDMDNNIIDIANVEHDEQNLVHKYIVSNDIVLELGARYGTVSVIINNNLNNINKYKHYVVEPDNNVWDALEKNKLNHNSKFKIIKGIISKKKHSLTNYSNYGTRALKNDNGNIKIFDIPDEKFNTLVVDCEGCFYEFYNEFPDFVNNLDKIILECDYGDDIDYKTIIDKLINNNFYIKENIKDFHYVFIKK
jgi:hypothetical protein